MLPSARKVRVRLGDAFYVVGKAPASEHDTLAGDEAPVAFCATCPHANHLALLDEDFFGRSVGQDRNA